MATTTLDPARLRRSAWKLALVACAMVGVAYGMVPFYRVFCEALGVDVADARLATPGQGVMRVEFDGQVDAALPVGLSSLDRVQSARAGGLIKARFMLTNHTDQPLTLRAVASFAPERAGRYLRKVECFCFDDITLEAREAREVYVVLAVDANMPAELGAATLYYSLFPAAHA
ncbi:cytochrome c oxidase assembly protein [Chitinibacteraceae bacterium HSL-7]